MTDPHVEEDLYALITAPDPQPVTRASLRAARRVPAWKLEEMVSGQPPVPSIRNTAVKPPPSIAARAAGRGLLVFASCLSLAALIFVVLIYTSGGVNLPGILAAATGLTQPSAPATQAPPAPTAAVEAPPAPVAPPPAAPVVEPAPAAPPAPPAATPPAPAADTPQGTTTKTVTDRPTPGHEEQRGPLGKPAPFAAGSTAYKFMHLRDDGNPVTYDPCRPIHYTTRLANAPAGGAQLIKDAITAVSRATGLVFIDDGATTEAPAAKHVSYQPARYGDRWAPVLIAWETNVEEPRFTNPEYGTTVLGLGGSEAVSVGSIPFTYVSGQLELNGPALGRMIARDGAAAARGVIEHELGHVVGLDHVNDATQLMNPSETPTVTTYAGGDLSGLAILGEGQCTPGL